MSAVRSDQPLKLTGGKNLFTEEEKALIEAMVERGEPYAAIYDRFPNRSPDAVLKWIRFYR